MTVSVSVRVLPAASRAVTVNVVEPRTSEMLLVFQLAVPVAVPLPPRLLDQVTCVTPTLSEALPRNVMLEDEVVRVELLVGDVMVMLGCVVSGL